MKKKELIKKFLNATKKGWQYAIDHTDDSIKIIHQKYNPNKSIEALNFEAKKIKELMLLGFYDIGEISKELVLREYKQLVRSGKLLPNQENKIMFFDDIVKKNVKKELFFTVKEQEFLNKKRTIKLCTDPDWMPFEGFEDGKYVGMVADYFDLIQKNLE